MSSPPVPAGSDADDRFRLVMASSPAGLAIVDLREHWLEVNPAFERMLGYRADELIGTPASVYTRPSAAAAPADAVPGPALAGDAATGDATPDDFLARLLDGREPAFHHERRCEHRDGRVVWAHAHVTVMRDGQGAPQYLLVQMRDITDERAVERERKAAAREVAESLDASHRQLQMFADAVAHDLRAPLRSIESFSALLAERTAGRLDDTDRDYLDRIRAAAGRMGGLLTGVNELSGVTRAELKPSMVDLTLLAEWVGAELQDAEPGRRAEILVQPDLTAWGDERLLKQLLTHLMGNAWKFSRQRDSTRIEVSGTRAGSTLELTVRDAGIGFDPRYAHKLFQPFQRLHGPDDGGGHGLGLAIAQRIAQRHGGRIRAESQTDCGTTVSVGLPAHRADEDAPDA